MADLTTGFLDHPPAEGYDQARLIGQRNELRGMEQSSLGMIPTEQRLNRQDASRRDVDDRLIGDVELAPLQRPPQVCLLLQPFQSLAIDARVEDREDAPASGLGPVERDVGGSQQIFRCAQIRRGNRDADRAADHQVVAFGVERSAQRGQELLGDLLDFTWICESVPTPRRTRRRQTGRASLGRRRAASVAARRRRGAHRRRRARSRR